MKLMSEVVTKYMRAMMGVCSKSYAVLRKECYGNTFSNNYMGLKK